MKTEYTTDSWENLKQFTEARIALGRTGNALPTQAILKFAADHAQAKDAVYASISESLFDEITQVTSLPILNLQSQVVDRAMYLRRPDLGKKLAIESIKLLEKSQPSIDINLIIAEGLSALAIEVNVIPFLKTFLLLSKQYNWNIPFICRVHQGRVAISDEIGERLNAKISVILIGERPGLSAADSMGIYLTYNPKAGNTDEKRNCISNVRPNGLDPSFAAHKLAYLIHESITKKLSGVELKDEYSFEIYRQQIKTL